MKAWVLEKAGEIHFKETDIKKPSFGEVLIRVKRCGICGSDIPRIFKDGAHVMPLIPGHEFSGEVVCVGGGVPEQWLNKRVGISPLIPCRKCGPCLSGRYELCRSYDYLGSRRDGGYAEYALVPADNLILLPENVSYEQAAMLEPMAVAAHAVRRLLCSFPEAPGSCTDKRAAVFGQGTIGLMILMLLLREGIRDVCVFGNHDIQKQKAVELGLSEDAFCDIRSEDINSRALERTGGAGFDLSFEAVGSRDNLKRVIGLSAPSSRVCLIGNPGSDMELERNVYWKLLRNQLSVCGSWNSSFVPGCGSKALSGKGMDGNRSHTPEEPLDDWSYVMRLMEDGGLHPEKLITHRYELKDAYRGLELMRDKKEEYIKIMLTDRE
ncbi:MAG TPA: galactitol-1-phosphate 5-dehydrogenase [Lachnospiraceae bacterium]|nr:galactitol-1-phosphate 5-dehydrogenase [Lachnospiraceae bacterium]